MPKMACFRRTKDPIKYIFYTISTLRHIRSNYSSWACNLQRISGVTERHSSSPLLLGRVHQGSGGLMLVRMFSIEAIASELLNLIKQLRERPSAPIKDAKAALVDCRWALRKAVTLAKKALSIEISRQALSSLHLNLEDFKDMNIILDHPKLKGETTVHSAITEVAAMVGENMKFGRGFSLSV